MIAKINEFSVFSKMLREMGQTGHHQVAFQSCVSVTCILLCYCYRCVITSVITNPNRYL